MLAFQARSKTKERPPARCSQKSHRLSGSPNRKLPKPLANSNTSRSRMATLTARAFTTGSLRYLAATCGYLTGPRHNIYLEDLPEQRLSTLTGGLCQEEVGSLGQPCYNAPQAGGRSMRYSSPLDEYPRVVWSCTLSCSELYLSPPKTVPIGPFGSQGQFPTYVRLFLRAGFLGLVKKRSARLVLKALFLGSRAGRAIRAVCQH